MKSGYMKSILEKNSLKIINKKVGSNLQV